MMTSEVIKEETRTMVEQSHPRNGSLESGYSYMDSVRVCWYLAKCALDTQALAVSLFSATLESVTS